MLTIALPSDCSEEEFRKNARACLARNLSPDDILFVANESMSLFEVLSPGDHIECSIPRNFAELLPKIICHRAEDRYALLYRLLWRIHHGERTLCERANDSDVALAFQYARAVDRDTYRMHAFLRFSERQVDDRKIFAAWFEPQHYTLRRATPFFVDRFTNMDWLIATPVGTAHWVDRQLSFGPPVARPLTMGIDAVLDEVWTTYYRATFNPARLRLKAMLAQMPKRHWHLMPETASIPQLARLAEGQLRDMLEQQPAQAPKFAEVLAQRGLRREEQNEQLLEALRNDSASCMRCPLHAAATQTVFGEGPHDAAVVLVGEQPGDQEDLHGKPFVGPAGAMLDRALAEAGIDKQRVYVTNAVKHFKFEPRGKRRIHRKPGTSEVHACRFWLQRELDIINPKLVIALGATAAASLSGSSLAVMQERGRLREFGGRQTLITVHPSFLLRLPDRAKAAEEYKRFVAELELARSYLLAPQGTPRSDL